MNKLPILGLWLAGVVLLVFIVMEIWQQYHAIRAISVMNAGNAKQSQVEASQEVPSLKGQPANRTLFGEAVEEVALKPSTRYNINGIFVSPGGQYSSAVLDIKGGPDRLIGVGDKLPGDSAYVVAIYPDRVIIQIDGHHEVVRLKGYENSRKGRIQPISRPIITPLSSRGAKTPSQRYPSSESIRTPLPRTMPNVDYYQNYLERLRTLQKEKALQKR